ncbi:GNAT family N-acetyltransferase [Kutzneria sp. NPDC052558]|uniref:GNAT family N-acetyltransferase n=1 Tax=Kutzneria sp. NPDC052558 TaxID=3364121 RepID=UPI0037CC8976
MILRPAEPGDLQAVHDICVETATQRDLDDLDLIGYIFADPYLTLAPEMCFVIADDEGVAGFTVGAADTVDFYRRWRAEWTPRFADRYPKPAQETNRFESLVSALHNPDRFLPAAVAEYPSHLHINLDARARRQGWGTKLLAELFDRQRAAGSPGVHLTTSTSNTRAIAFYHTLGFEVLDQPDEGTVMGLRFDGSGRMESSPSRS